MKEDDVTPLMDGYRECARHVWNCYFSKDAEPEQDWNLRDDFNTIAVGLFRSLVLRKLGREHVDVLPDHVIARQPLLSAARCTRRFGAPRQPQRGNDVR